MMRLPHHPRTKSLPSFSSSANNPIPSSGGCGIPASRNTTDSLTPHLQPLEPRLLLSGTHYIVDSLLDVVADDGHITLREAIEAANTNTAPTADVQPGSPDETDLITFADSLFTDGPAVITLTDSDIAIIESLNIQGPSQHLLIIDTATYRFESGYIDTHTTISDITFAGGIGNYYGDLTLNNLTISRQLSSIESLGHGINNNTDGNLTLNNCTISGNTTYRSGGGIHTRGSGILTLNNSTVSNNSAVGGGGISNYEGTLILNNSVVSDNVSMNGGSGGGIFNSVGTVMLINSEISNNAAEGAGGGIRNWADDCILTMINSSVSNNTSQESGGGMFTGSSEVTIINSILSGNSSEFQGSAIRGYNGSTTSIINSVISDNSVKNGGAAITTSSQLTLTHCTVAGNFGGGVAGDSTLINTIVAFNDADGYDDLRGYYDLQGSYSITNSLIGVDPHFFRNPSPGQDNQWDTPDDIPGDYRLQSTSPAIDAGDNSLLPTDEFDLDSDGDTTEPIPFDIANRSRVRNETVDIGAYEFQPATHYIVDSLADVVADDGAITLREAIEAANTNSAVTSDVLPGSPDDTDLITFSDWLIQDGPATIKLNGDRLTITDNLKIQGLGQDLLTIDADKRSGVFSTSGVGNRIELSDITIEGHTVSGVNNFYGTLTLTDITISGDSSIDHPSGHGIINIEGAIILKSSNISGNRYSGYFRSGGGIYNRDGDLTLIDSIVSGNTAYENGGGIYNQGIGNITLINSIVSDNTGYYGGGICSGNGTLTLINSIVTGNTANYTYGDGGGIYSIKGTTFLIDSTVSYNSAKDTGGGIYSESGTTTLINTKISNNWSYRSGGIYHDAGEMTITNSILSGNSAEYYGGAISHWRGRLTLTNSVISGNSVKTVGGGIYNNGVYLTMNNCTVSGNSAGDFGGGIAYATGLELNNSIVAMNNAPEHADLYGSYKGQNNLIGVDPQFVRNPSPGHDGIWGTADDIPGDYRLQSTSPAINAGDNTLLPADEFDLDNDGDTTEPIPYDFAYRPRIRTETVDIGAYEFQPATHYIVDSLADTVADDGHITLREAIEAANTNSAVTGDVQPGSDDEADVITFDQAALSSEAFVEFGQPLTITLDGNRLTIYDDLQIQGLGQNLLTIDADRRDGVINAGGTGNYIELSDMTITGGNDFGIRFVDGALTLTNISITGNHGSSISGKGGGIYNKDGIVILNNCTVSDNIAVEGGGIYNAGGEVILNNTTVTRNSAYNVGGIHNNKGTVSLFNSSVSNNSAGYSVGGIHNDHGTVSLFNSSVSNNSAVKNFGAMNLIDGVTELTNSIVSNNSAAGGVGGIRTLYNSKLTLINSLVSGNSATYGGGGIDNDIGLLTLINTTVSGNSVSLAGSGGIHNPGRMVLTNSIVAMNDAPEFADISNGYYDLSSVYFGQNNLIGVDPQFVRNPSPGEDGLWGTDDDIAGDYHLLSGSPAIDAGLYDSTIPIADLDGHERYDDPYVTDTGSGPISYTDIGAYEASFFMPLPNADFNGDRVVGLLDLTILGEHYNQTTPGTTPASKSHGDANLDGHVDLLDLVTLGEQYNSIAITQNQSAEPDRQPATQSLFLDNPTTTTTPTTRPVFFHNLDQLTEDDQTSTITLF